MDNKTKQTKKARRERRAFSMPTGFFAEPRAVYPRSQWATFIG